MDSLASAPDAALVGREREFATLTARLDRAIAGQGGVVLVAGEPGIGKTRLAEELAATARERGARVLWGRCYEGEGAPAYWPWVEILRAVIRGEPAVASRDAGGADDVDLAPEARALLMPVPSGAAAPGLSPEAAHPAPDAAEGRFRLFDAVTAYLGARAARQPHLLILDDLHWADASSLLLLRFLARGVHTVPLLVLGAYRDVEVDRDHPLAAALAALGRERGYQHLSLSGLTVDATAALVEEAGREEAPSDSLTRALHRLTGGNPLFIQQTARHLAETGQLAVAREGADPLATRQPLLATPESVRGVIRQRLTRLSGDAARVLTVAAVVGREFDVATLSAVVGADGLPVLEALDAAEAARLVTVAPALEVALRYRFAHDLIRETLYSDLDRAARARLHRRVGEALEGRFRMNLESHVPELAYHFVRAAPGGDSSTGTAVFGGHPAAGVGRVRTKAVAYARQAGDRALRQFAYDEAARWFEQAVELLDQATPVDAAAQCDLLLAQGDALLLAGDPQRVVDGVAPAALALAEALPAGGERASRACRLALAGLNRYAGPGALTGSPQFRAWAERADRHAPPNTADRVHADVALAQAQAVSRGGLRDTFKLYRRALAQARELDDPDTLFYAAFQVIDWAGGPRHQAERLRLAQEFSTRPRAGVGVRNLARVLRRCGSVLLDWGERARAEALWQEVAELAAHAREPNLLLYEPIREAILATLDGKLEAALSAAARVIERTAELGSPLHGRRFAARLRERPLQWLGPGVALPDALRADLHQTVTADVWEANSGANIALRLAWDGHLAPARRTLGEELEQLRADPGDEASFPGHVVHLLELAVLVGDRAAAELLAERVAVLAPCAIADWALTTVARHLGAAATLLGDRARARAYSEQALAVAGSIRFRPEVALASLQLAEILADEPGEDEPTRRHLELAIAELRDMKMQPALERALRLQDRLPAAKAAPAPSPVPTGGPERLTSREVEVLRLLAAGRSNREIADELVVSIRTIDHHIERIYRKLDVRGRVDATTWALRHGLVPPE